MKICMFSRSLLVHAMGGMELHVQTLSRELAKKGVDVTLITTSHPGGKEYEIENDVKVYYLKGTTPGKYGPAYFAKSAEKFKELNKTSKFDIIHSQSAGAYGILANGIAKKLDIPSVVSLHGTTIDEIKTRLRLGLNARSILSLVKNTYNYLFKDKKYLQASDMIIATSDSQVEVIKKYYGIDAQKITLVYNGIDDVLFSPRVVSEETYRKYGVKTGEPVIACCARLKKEKGLQNIISILPGIKKEIPGVKLLIAGAGEYASTLARLVTALKLEDSVKMIGQIEYQNLPELMNICSVFVNSTIRENGYDLTIPQAMACGKPVIASDIRSVMSVIESGITGYIYKRNDLTELESLVVKLLNDGQLRGKIGEAAKIAAQKQFTVRNMAENTINVYKKTIGEMK